MEKSVFQSWLYSYFWMSGDISDYAKLADIVLFFVQRNLI